MKKFIKNFITCGILGWCLEITFTAIGSLLQKDYRLVGKTSIWMFFIYGAGACLYPICRKSRKFPCIVRGTIYAILIFIAEYISGKLLMMINCCPWDYSGAKWNIGKVIRLDFFIFWFGTGLLLEHYLFANDRKHDTKTNK